MKSESSFSICKGKFAIRFSCQNQHNFFLTTEKISEIDIESIKREYKKYRLNLQHIYETKEKEKNSKFIPF